MRILNILVLLPFVTGCGILTSFIKPEISPPEIKTVVERVPLKIYQPPLPEEIMLEEVKFFVITKENLEDQIKKIETLLGDDFVVFAITPQTYENMAYNLQEIRRYVRQQKEVILYYREATKSKEGATAEDWLQQNKKVVEAQQNIVE